MGKFYNYRNFSQYMFDIKIDRKHELDKFLKHVAHIANGFPRNSMAIGILDINDLIQAGNVGLVEAWKRIDWDKIKSSPNPDGQLWSFLKIRIKFAIRQEINAHGSDVKIPTRDLKAASKELKSHEKILVNIFPKFFDKVGVCFQSYNGPYRSLQLEEIITNQLEKVESNYFNIDLLLQFYGIGFDKMSLKDLAVKYNKTENAIKQLIFTTRNKLKTKEFEDIIENFYKNQ